MKIGSSNKSDGVSKKFMKKVCYKKNMKSRFNSKTFLSYEGNQKDE